MENDAKIKLRLQEKISHEPNTNEFENLSREREAEDISVYLIQLRTCVNPIKSLKVAGEFNERSSFKIYEQ